MKLVIKLANPKTERDRMFRAEAIVDDLRDPGEAWVVIHGREYLVEVHYEDSTG